MYESITEGGSYKWNGTIYTEKGDYEYHTKTSAGCDSTAWLHLAVTDKEIVYPTKDSTTCAGTPVTFYGKTYETSGIYKTELIKGTGTDPDTVYTLNLTVYELEEIVLPAVTLCYGETYPWLDGKEYTSSQELSYTEKDVHGCDKKTTLELTILPKVADTYFTKTIIDGETYTWNGKDYETEGVYSETLETENGCDSIVTLNLTVQENIVENIAFIIAEQCAGEGALEIQVQHTGLLTDARLTFDEKAIQAGFENGTYPIENDIVTVPYNVRAGIFSVDIDLLFHNRLKHSATEPFTLLYPRTVLEQGWMDAIFVLTHDYNGGYDFTDFQWYKKGKMLVGETGPYLYQPLEVGAEYSAMLTEVSGLRLMTCPLIITEHTDITMYPTVVSRKEMIHVTVSQNARLNMYSSMGEKVSTYSLIHGDTQIVAPGTQGIYLAEVVLESGKRKVIKIMVR